ncbi:lipoyl(octanoyl) transferase LipB [Synoicihabitans lomoniglobus]|uniref:Octanoyltransferase n=1 Tax=Synoicihabitans lomoniglobus TaxID=2909285 RepID=A0AAE9ZV65_9BACT|nr:lipoyl(octanoyl) transferase LipB [Opitutaceae bacterium LMO-M01]WED63068.1 lipoyl(octanoyl) transferase LipB [Opitutaceae bacterium LMO-M01]
MLPTAPSTVQIVDWGRTTYGAATERQRGLVGERIAGKTPDTLVFTEHDPVYTVGLRQGAAANLLWDPAQLAAQGITVAETNRGGDITYHGPGQIVGYPIVDLSAVKDLHAYLRFLEEVMIRAVGALGLAATRRDGLTGIWVGSRKIAAIGVAVRRWVAYHGFALNVNPNLDHFAGIVPCGIASADGTVTSLARELPTAPPSMDEVRAVLVQEFTTLWPEFIAGRSTPTVS